VLTAVVTTSAAGVEVTLSDGASSHGAFVAADEATEGAGPEKDLNPIFPELKEVVWGFGSFVVLALVLRLFLFRKVREGMSSRYDMIEGDFDAADTLMASARSDVAEYEAQVAAARAEAQKSVDAARATLEGERSVRLAEVNARIADKRAVAAAEVDAAKLEARGHVEAAVADVAALAGQLATGKAPSPASVTAAVSDAMSQGVSA
jgi:F-type H+-transporting ATPase subunit b